MTSQPALFDEDPKGPGLDVTLVRNAVDSVAADAAFVALRELVAWRQDYFRRFGDLISVPRPESWVAE